MSEHEPEDWGHEDCEVCNAARGEAYYLTEHQRGVVYRALDDLITETHKRIARYDQPSAVEVARMALRIYEEVQKKFKPK